MNHYNDLHGIYTDILFLISAIDDMSKKDIKIELNNIIDGIYNMDQVNNDE